MSSDRPAVLSLTQIFRFWAPLAGTWLMMSVEGPFLSALIARLPDPKYNLAAYGVAFALALIVEAPIIMILSAATSLIRDRQSFLKLRFFTYGLNGWITIVMLGIILPPVFNFLAVRMIGLPESVARLTHVAVMLLLPWPAAIGYRRFYQGILIRNHATRRVAYGTVIRLLSMGLTASVLFLAGKVPGVYVGAAALAVGVTMEALATRIMVRPFLRGLLDGQITWGEAHEELTLAAITRFYYPLALTSMLTLGVHPIVTFFIGRSPSALDSLAVLPVVNSLVFIFRGLGLSYQEVAIALIGDHLVQLRPVRKYALVLALCLVTGLSLVALTPLSLVWFRYVSGLSLDLARFAQRPLAILALFPAFSVWISYQRSILVNQEDTLPITLATGFEVATIVSVLYFTVIRLGWVGVMAAATAYFCGRVIAVLYLTTATHKSIQMAAGRSPGST